jgi:hypothetical protein
LPHSLQYSLHPRNGSGDYWSSVESD